LYAGAYLGKVKTCWLDLRSAYLPRYIRHPSYPSICVPAYLSTHKTKEKKKVPNLSFFLSPPSNARFFFLPRSDPCCVFRWHLGDLALGAGFPVRAYVFMYVFVYNTL